MNDIKQIPCNIITGFLGVGKTTAILHLLSQKPKDEKWAVLVNEFGEVGIDGALFSGSNDDVAIREIPGGCMCCVSGVPMQIGLTQLIRQAKPDRILIEPTGLGHPNEVIAVLQGEIYADILDLRAVITLIDPRKLSDSRYTNHKIFSDQINVADVLIGNKIDCSETEDIKKFDSLLSQKSSRYSDKIVQGKLDIAWLDVDRKKAELDPHSHEHSHDHSHKVDALQLAPGQEILKKISPLQENGFNACGWILTPEKIFDYDKLFNWFCGLDVTRAKAVLICDGVECGVFAFNSEDGVLSVMELDDCMDQRLELINPEVLDWESIEDDWLQCLL